MRIRRRELLRVLRRDLRITRLNLRVPSIIRRDLRITRRNLRVLRWDPRSIRRDLRMLKGNNLSVLSLSRDPRIIRGGLTMPRGKNPRVLRSLLMRVLKRDLRIPRSRTFWRDGGLQRVPARLGLTV